MSNTRLVESITYPVLNMVKVDMNTAKVVESKRTQLDINSKYMIHFRLDVFLSNFDNAHRLILRFRQDGDNKQPVYLVRSTEGYLNYNDVKQLYYVEEGNTIYREVDITGYFTNDSTAKYFAITSEIGLSLYTSSAPTGYCPELRMEKIGENDFLPNQAELDGNVGNDNYKINLRSGKLYYDKHLLSVETTDSIINLSMSYSMAAKNTTVIKYGYETGLGRGFKFNYQQIVYESGNNYIYVDGQYKLHTFKLADNLSVDGGTKVYYDTCGNYTILEKLSTGFKIISKNQELVFDTSGKLVKNRIKRTNNHTYEEVIEYDSSNRITKISSGQDYIQIDYGTEIENADGSILQVVTLTGSNSQVVTITLLDSNIVSVENTNGIVTTYAYDTTSLSLNFSTFIVSPKVYVLSNISERNNKIKFNYTDTFKVENVKKYYNNNLITTEEIVYEGAETKLKKHKHSDGSTSKIQSIEMRYQYNDKGEVENIYEVIGDRITALKHYINEYDEREEISFNSGAEVSLSNVELNENCSTIEASVNEIELQNSGEFILSMACETIQTKSYSLFDEYKIYAEIYLKEYEDFECVERVKLGTIEFDLNKTLNQFKFFKFTSPIYRKLEIVFYNTSSAHKANFSGIAVTPKQSSKEISCVNIVNGDVIATYNGDLYKNHINNFEYTDSNEIQQHVSSIKMTTSDIAESQRLESLSDTNAYIVWYNNGEGMVYNVKNVRMPYAEETQVLLKDIVNTAVSTLVLKDSNGNNVKGTIINYINFVNGECSLHTINKWPGYTYSSTTSVVKYDKYNKLISETKNGNHIKEYIYDNQGNNTKIRVVANNKIIEEQYVYDNSGKIVSITNDNGTQSYTYNTIGNLTSIKNSNNDIIKNITYKTDLETIAKVGATVNNVVSDVTYEYDEHLREIKHHSAQSSFEYSYDNYGRISSIKKNDIVILSYEYLMDNTKTTVTVTNQKNEKTKYVYDRYGNLIELYNNDVLVLECSYSDYNGLSYEAKLCTKKILLNGSMILYIYSYDAFGNLTKVDDSYYTGITFNQTNTLEVDDVNRQVVDAKEVVRIQTGKAVKERLAIYNLENNMQKQYNYFTYCDNDGVQYIDRVPVYEFNLKCWDQINTDDLGRASNRITSFGDNHFLKEYTYKTTGNTSSYLVSNEVLSFSLDNQISQEITQTSYTYTDGRITSITKGNNTVTYGYDSIGRLISEVNPKLNINRTYSYDSEGNMYRSDKVYEYDGQVLIKYDGYSLNYTDGFLGTYRDNAIEFTSNRLTRYGIYSYNYDGLGRRISKESPSGTHNFYYDYSNRLIKEIFENGKVIEYIYGNNGLVGFIYENATYYYSRNIFGDVEAIYDTSGNLVASYEYDAWGNCRVYNPDGTQNTFVVFVGNVNPIRYRGYYYDIETGWFWLSSRYYSPELCRFISPDDISYLDPTSINGLNLYCYCMNNPIMYADPSGHWIETVFDLFSLGASVVEVVINPANPWAWAGLIGDAVDLLPFVTGVGEGIRATKMVKYADDVIDASYDTIKFVKAADMVDDFSDGGTMLRRVGNLDDYHTLTKTTHVDGTKLHKLFMDNGTPIMGTRLRVDGLNELTNTVFELKPYNIRNTRKGVKQILNYNGALGGGYKMVIVLY